MFGPRPSDDATAFFWVLEVLHTRYKMGVGTLITSLGGKGFHCVDGMGWGGECGWGEGEVGGGKGKGGMERTGCSRQLLLLVTGSVFASGIQWPGYVFPCALRNLIREREAVNFFGGTAS